MSDSFDLERFVKAQDPVYQHVREELLGGQKRSHWMWFVFPQLRGLGYSHTANKYGIASREEAEAYLKHPVLGARLVECTRLVNGIEGRAIGEILGYPDDLKFKSSMSLFAGVAPEETAFREALRKYFGGEMDPATVERLR